LNQLDLLDLRFNPNIGQKGARSLLPCYEFIDEWRFHGCGVFGVVEEEMNQNMKDEE